MRMRIFKLLTISAAILASCSEMDEQDGNIAGNSSELRDTIYQVRNPNLPCVKTHGLGNGSFMSTRATANEDKNGNSGELLGYSYKMGNTILGDPQNVGLQVIDIDKVSDYDHSLISKNHIGHSSVGGFSYADYDDFLKKSQLIKKSSSGFSLNIFGLVKIGRKHRNTKVFASYINDSTRSVYGEANVAYYNSEFKLNPSESSLHVYALTCLSKSFMRDLYGSPTGNILSNYGDFIMTDYITGGKMTTLLAGMTKSTVSVQERLQAMDQEINASRDFTDDELVRNDDNNVFFSKASKISDKMKKVFEIGIKSNVYGRYNPQTINPLCEVVTVDFDNMHWFENKNLNIKYIYSKENKVAFSVYEDDLEGDYVLDEYGIRDWFDEKCTYKSIALGTITRTFKIIGL